MVRVARSAIRRNEPLDRETAPRSVGVLGCLLVSLFAAGCPGGTEPAPDATVAEPVALGRAPAEDTSPGASGTGIPFGPFNWPPEAWQTGRFTAAVVTVHPETAAAHLEAARTAGLRLFVSLAGKSKRHYARADRSFDPQLWKDRVWPRFEGVDLDPFLRDGTIVGHYLIDEPHARGRWGGRVVPYEAIEEIARFSKEHWPAMATLVRAHPTWLADAPFRWVHLDAGWAQYSSRKGDVDVYARRQAEAASAAGLGWVAGLNVVDGGDGSSRIRSYYDERKWMMSAAELRANAAALLTPDACALIFWQWSEDHPRYLERSEIRAAMSDLARMARGHPGPACGP